MEKRETLIDCFTVRYDYTCTMCGKTFAQLANLTEPTTDDEKKAFEAKYGMKFEDYEKKYNKVTTETVSAHKYLEDAKYLISSNDTEFGKVYDEKHPRYSVTAKDKGATCTTGAYLAYKCMYCDRNPEGKTAKDHPVHYVEIVPALGHDWSDWETVYEPNEGENETGLYVRHCNRCDVMQNRHTIDNPDFEKNSATRFVEKLFNGLLGEDDLTADRIYALSEGLEDGKSTAADVIATFFGSDAFNSKGLNNIDKVALLYNVLLNRAPDGNVYKWADMLDAGVSNNLVINGFTGSEEFKEFADAAGIEAGQLATEERDVNPRVTAFVNRCYKVALERKGEPGGLNYWTAALLNGAQSPKQVAAGFVFSDEYKAAEKIADETKVEGVVKDLYNLYLGRDGSETEVDWYVDLLSNGMKLEELNNMFADSVEFTNIVSSYGLNPNL
jgi:DNA-directed RNA polymerase subunit RPC12/RpoP